MIKQMGIEPQYATLKKGQALLWAANLLHGGSPQRDKRRTRLSQVTHYFFENCKYFTLALATAVRSPAQYPRPSRHEGQQARLSVRELTYDSQVG